MPNCDGKAANVTGLRRYASIAGSLSWAVDGLGRLGAVYLVGLCGVDACECCAYMRLTIQKTVMKWLV